MNAARLARAFEIRELDQSYGKDYDAHCGKHEQRAVEDPQLVVGDGAQVRSVEWICPRVVKEESKEVFFHATPRVER